MEDPLILIARCVRKHLLMAMPSLHQVVFALVVCLSATPGISCAKAPVSTVPVGTSESGPRELEKLPRGLSLEEYCGKRAVNEQFYLECNICSCNGDGTLACEQAYCIPSDA